MRLKYIKLVGFKSFVDPTKVPFPHQMTCVVGPNGCGKSNVIDAVRWVLGESSAKNLRGDAMTDVIFNGSNARKPVSQASVELVFDNSQGRIQGEYASYAEISVKRVVTREAQSTYLLNGSKCRRRDITDLFLGTGLGPRSYAIIEQGMISRLIESKPQELRVFIEEAAGISKYKERRRETESRMQHTRENLERLSDVRDELGKQLEKLQRQAQAARRYKTLKADERTYKAQLQALRWLQNENSAEQLRAKLALQETELERWVSEQRGGERGTDALRERERELKQDAEQVHQRYYQLGAEVTKAEQALQHQRQLSAQKEQRQRQLNDELAQLHRQQQQDQEQHEEIRQELATLEPEYAALAETLAQHEAVAEQAEQRWQQWQDDYHQSIQQQQRQQQAQQQLQVRIETSRQQQQQLQQQAQQHQQDLAAVGDQLQEQRQRLAAFDLATLEAKVHAAEAEVTAAEAAIAAHQDKQSQVRALVDEQQGERQQLRGKISSVERLLAANQSDWGSTLTNWLAVHQQSTIGTVEQLLQPRHAETLRALDSVLHDWLQAPVLVAEPTQIPDLIGARLVWLPQTPTQPPQDSVAAQLQGPLQGWPFLQQLGYADTPAQAQQMVKGGWSLVVTAEGTLIANDRLQAPQVEEDQSQLLQQQELQNLEQSLHTCEADLTALQAEDQKLAQQQQALAEQLRAASKALDAHKADWITQRERADHTQQRITELQERQQQLEAQVTENTLAQEVMLERIMRAEDELEQERVQAQGEQDQQVLDAEREQLQQQYQQTRAQLQATREQSQTLTLKRQQLQSQQQHNARIDARTAEQIANLTQQLANLSEHDLDSDEAQQLLVLKLEEAIAQREVVEQERIQINEKVSEVEAELRSILQGQQGIDQKIEQARQQCESLKLELGVMDERSRNILQVLQDMQQSLKPVLENMPDDADEKRWQQELDRLQAAISRLGAINLAAIEEADIQAERKGYLDQQHEDLQASLDTLETAIRKIDKETRQRFKTTYDAVNADLQALFPKVFGGGSAYLELTDDDLLDTGVTIMARPPGKKNSTIHLLSGGEKALTALSLVFAIFRLNPAPFCLLDEVDAPLDDANVGRFCRLVEEMSETVQFIYISHNKVAMEMASHLAGVTMQEPGVSRLVAVDVDEAVAMTQA